jgi:hypothetical protein
MQPSKFAPWMQGDWMKAPDGRGEICGNGRNIAVQAAKIAMTVSNMQQGRRGTAFAFFVNDRGQFVEYTTTDL